MLIFSTKLAWIPRILNNAESYRLAAWAFSFSVSRTRNRAKAYTDMSSAFAWCNLCLRVSASKSPMVICSWWDLRLETSSSWSGMRHIEICRHGCEVWWTQRASTVEHPLMPISKMTLCCKLFVEFSSSFACLYILKLLREIDWSVCVEMKCLGRHFTPNRIYQSWFGRYWNWVGLICSLHANQELMWACSASTYKSV